MELIDNFWHDLQEDESQTLEQMYGVQSDDEKRNILAEKVDRISTDPMM